MTIERMPLDEALALIDDGRITDAKTVIGLRSWPGDRLTVEAAGRTADTRSRWRTSSRGCARSGAGRRTRSPPTGATCAATPAWLRRARAAPSAEADEADVVDYVGRLRAAGPGAGLGGPGRWSPVRSLHRFLARRGPRRPATPPPTSSSPGCPGACPRR